MRWGALATALLPFRTGQVGSVPCPPALRFPHCLLETSLGVTAAPILPSCLCAPTQQHSGCSLTCEGVPPSPPCPPHTTLGVQASRGRLLPLKFYTPNYTESDTACTPHYTKAPQFLPVTVTGQWHTPPSACTRSRPRCGLHTPASSARATGVGSPGLARGPPASQSCTLVAHAPRCTHGRARTHSIIILDMPFLLHDSSSGDAQSCHLDEK